MAKEYIERDELLERFERYSSGFLIEDDYDTALTIIHGAPIDDDLVEVVRCAECKGAIPLPHSDYVVCCGCRKMPKTGFCSYGERKDGTDNA